MDVVLVAVGVALITVAFLDLINMLVTTATSYARLWPARLLWVTLYGAVRSVAARLPDDSNFRERLLAAFGPLLLVALLAVWVSLQVLGFGLIWHGLGGVDGAVDLADHLYYSGVVYFTIGFGEIVPVTAVPRFGALVEAFAGVVTTALVIGYLPTLYGAYSERERPLMMLDHGSGERITPVALIKAWSPDADPRKLELRFQEWEEWTAAVAETHSTVPVLRLFRSHDRRQHWVTALGVVTDAALLAQAILGAYDGRGYWLIRRATGLFDEMVSFATADHVAHYRQRHRRTVRDSDGRGLRDAYEQLREHGFELVPFDVAIEHARELRHGYAPHMELLIDYLLAPRGFWATGGTEVPLLSRTHPEMLEYEPSAD